MCVEKDGWKEKKKNILFRSLAVGLDRRIVSESMALLKEFG